MKKYPIFDSPIAAATIAASGLIPMQLTEHISDEVYLDGEIIGVKRISEDECRKKFPNSDPDVDGVLRVDYELWTVAIPIKLGSPDEFIHRIEHVYVEESVVREGIVVTYGLGPEKNYLEWGNGSDERGSAESLGVPEIVLDNYVEEVLEENLEDIEEWLDGDGANIPDDIHPTIRKVYERVLASSSEQDE